MSTTQRTYGHGSITLTAYESSGRISVEARAENSVMDRSELIEFVDTIRKPQQIAAHEDLLPLPVGSVVLDAFGASCTKVREGLLGWRRVTPAVANGEGHWHAPYFPATVLHRGAA